MLSKITFSEILKFLIWREIFSMFHFNILLKLLMHENTIFEISVYEK